MKKFTILLLLISTVSYGQTFQLTKQKENTRNGKAIYYVLKSDPDVKHGEYKIKSWGGNEILLEGKYDTNKKVGHWTERYYGRTNNGTLKNSGKYQDDQKVGIWTYYDHQGTTVQTYDHSTNQIITSKENSRSEFVGGRSALSYDLNQQIPFPKELNTPGTNKFSIDTNVLIELNSDNEIKSVSFTKPIGYGIEEIIETWLRSESNDWVFRGDGMLEMPIKFNMQF